MDYKKFARIDLHIHSSASDGTLSPSEILARACHLKLKAIAITDHDTIEGSRAALSLGIPPAIQFLTGVEISATPPSLFPLSGSFHILGYAIRLDDAVLETTLKKLQAARKSRNPQIIKRLNELGIDLTLEELNAEFNDGQLGRPHIAQLMVKKGYVRSIDEAFDEFISNGKPAYIDKFRLDCSEAIDTIRGAGGFAVLAHPFLLEKDSTDIIEDLVVHLKKKGLQGLEVYYPTHTPEETEHFAEIARRHGLLITGGTDFHGAVNPDIEMGYGNGTFYVPEELYEKIVSTWQQAGLRPI